MHTAERTTNKPDPKAVRELWAYVKHIVAREKDIMKTRERMRYIREECRLIVSDEWMMDAEALRRLRELIG